MKYLLKILSVIGIVLMATFAGALITHLAANNFDLPPDQAAICGIIAFAIIAAAAFIPGLFPKGSLAMAITAKAIPRNVNPKNIAGIGESHYYAFVEDIATWPTALTPDFIAATTFGGLVTILVGDLFVMVADKYFHAIPCSPEAGDVKSTLVGPVESKAFENTAAFQNAGNNDALAGFYAYTANKPIVLAMMDLNGNMKIVGTQASPARLDTGDRQSGIKVADGNMFKAAYKAYSSIPCPTCLSPLPLDPTEPAFV